jgi:hypothetical protein
VGEPLRPAELLVGTDVTADDEERLVQLLLELGVRAQARRTLAYRGPALDWLVLVSLPLNGFLSGLGSEAVRGCYEEVRRLARRLTGRAADQGKAPVPLILEDSATGLRIVLEADLPIEAYQELPRLNLADYQAGPLHYDRYRGAWRSELDEAAG